ncbi:MAG: hypothetical protein ACYC4R_08200 [Anaerolineae bacterium]
MHRLRWALVLIILLTALTGCQQPAATPTAEPTVAVEEPTAAPTAAPTVAEPTAAPTEIVEGTTLQVEGPDGALTLTMADLQALPATEGWAGTKSSTGRITPPSLFKGVAIQDLWESVGAFDETYAVNVVAKDGYAMTFSYDQIANGAFTTFDPATGDEVTRDEELTLIVAYGRDGAAIPEDTDGSMRLVIVSPEKDQVTDGHWAVKWVRQVQLKEAKADWFLQLEGAITEEMDRATFESGSAPNCHGASWTDADGNVWTGIPFYYLMGRVDDENKHESAAFNYDLAQAGYAVHIVAADGYEVTFDSTRLARNKMIILAYLMNDEPLEDKYFPLRLVGDGLEKGEMIGAVSRVVLKLDAVAAEPTEAAAETPEAGEVANPELQAGTLHVMGLVGTETSFTAEQLQALGIVQLTAEHPKKGPMDFEGVPLSKVLEQVEPQADAGTVVLTSGDGYTVEVNAADVAACSDCMVTIEDDGLFNLVMPGMESSAWAKDIRLIRFK